MEDVRGLKEVENGLNFKQGTIINKTKWQGI